MMKIACVQGVLIEAHDAVLEDKMSYEDRMKIIDR